MPEYNFSCDKCEVSWAVEGHMESPPQAEDNPCPECGEVGYREFFAPYLKFVGLDFYSVRAREEKFAREGMDRDTAHRFYNESIRNSSDRMKSGGTHYRKMGINPEDAVKAGIATKVTDKKTLEKRQEASTFWKDKFDKVKKGK